MMVEENVSATAMYSEASGPIPIARQIRKPKSEVNPTCPSPVASATLPRLRTSDTSSLSPTRNSSTAMLIWLRVSMKSVEATMASASGPASTPSAMKATISGWRRISPTKPRPAASKTRRAIS